MIVTMLAVVVFSSCNAVLSMENHKTSGDIRRRLRSATALLVVSALAGVAVAFAVSGFSRHEYRVSATVKIDSGTASAADRNAMLRAIREQTLAPSSLDRIVADLDLEADMRFMGTEVSARNVLLDIFAPREVSPVEREEKLRNRLAESIDFRDVSGSLAVVATTPGADISARLGNHIARYVTSGVNSGVFSASARTLMPHERRQRALDTARAELSAFEASHDRAVLAKIMENRRQTGLLDEQIGSVRNSLVDLRLLGGQASSMTASDVLTRSLPDDARFFALADIRERYAAARLAVEEVSVAHGPKHPRAIVANETLANVRASAGPALRAVQAEIRADEEQLARSLDELQKQRSAVAAGMDGATADLLAQFDALRKAVDDARSNLDNAADVSTGIPDGPVFRAMVSGLADAGNAESDAMGRMMLALLGASSGMLLGSPFAVAVLAARRRNTKERSMPDAVYQVDDFPDGVISRHIEESDILHETDSGYIGADLLDVQSPLTAPPLPPAAVAPAGIQDVAASPALQEPVASEKSVHAESVARRVRAVLARGGSNSMSAEGTQTVPPLMAAVMRGDIREEIAARRTQGMQSAGKDRLQSDLRNQEIANVRLEMARLGGRVRHFASTRGVSR